MDMLSEWTNGTWLAPPSSGEDAVSGITIDSRDVTEGVAFIAIAGDKDDGHAHASSAAGSGAAVAVVERPVEGLAIPMLQVESSRKALADLARHWRMELDRTTVVAITGSCGKTTTRGLLQNVLSEDASTSASKLYSC